jgi:hypothetical protein
MTNNPQSRVEAARAQEAARYIREDAEPHPMDVFARRSVAAAIVLFVLAAAAWMYAIWPWLRAAGLGR